MNTQFLYSRLVNLERQMPKFYVSETRPPNLKEGEIWFQIESIDVPVSDYFFRFDALELKLNDGDPVVIWEDLSGNRNHVQQDKTNVQPIYSATGLNGMPTVVFDGDYLESGPFQLDHVDGITLFVVTDASATVGSSSTVLSIGNADTSDPHPYILRHSASSGEISSVINNASGETRSAVKIVPTPALYTVFYDKSTHVMYSNGAASTPGTYSENINAHNALRIGSRMTQGGGEPYLGNISEIIYFSRALAPTEIHAMHTYLMDKWGI